jgi:predicted dehydrogenase
MAGKKLKVVMVGAGGFGKRHADFFHNDERVEFSAVCGRTPDRTRERANLYGIRAYTNIGEMIKNETPDLVDVVTHEKDQLNAIMQVLEANSVKAVLTEKPLGINVDEAWEMVKTAGERNIDFGVDFNRRFTIPYQLVAKWVNEGSIGDLAYITLKFSHDPYDPPKEEDPYRWFFNVYPHAFDTLVHLGGPIKIISGFFTKPKDHFYYKRFTINFLFKNGAVGNLIGGGEGKWRHQSEYLEAGGNKGQAAAVNLMESAQLRLHDNELEQVWRPAIAEGPGLDFFAESVANHLAVAVDCLTKGKLLPVHASAALRAQILMRAAKKSHEEGGNPVNIDLFVSRLNMPGLENFINSNAGRL